MNIHDERFHEHMERESLATLERIAEPDEIDDGEGKLKIRLISSREMAFDHHVAEAERVATAPCICTMDDVMEGTRCKACCERADQN